MDHRMTVKAYCSGEQIASFIDDSIARIFAVRFTKYSAKTIELVNKSGMIGQYVNGKSTEEFVSHHNACFKKE